MQDENIVRIAKILLLRVRERNKEAKKGWNCFAYDREGRFWRSSKLYYEDLDGVTKTAALIMDDIDVINDAIRAYYASTTQDGTVWNKLLVEVSDDHIIAKTKLDPLLEQYFYGGREKLFELEDEYGGLNVARNIARWESLDEFRDTTD
tara:strand:+ start:935 stop:1381 length:447 start_codon:yes stop_codon:yes gene_type:complete